MEEIQIDKKIDISLISSLVKSSDAIRVIAMTPIIQEQVNDHDDDDDDDNNHDEQYTAPQYKNIAVQSIFLGLLVLLGSVR